MLSDKKAQDRQQSQVSQVIQRAVVFDDWETYI